MPEFLSRRNVLTQLGVAGAWAALGALSSDAQAQTAAPSSGPIADLLAAAYKDGEYTLPPLPYGYDALEPNIDQETMKLHHDKHHAGYVKGLNAALKDLTALYSAGGEINSAQATGLEEDLSFNLGGHILHTVFWGAMGPNAGGDPSGAIADAITKDFGSVETFRAQFTKVAAGVKGSGWALLAFEPLGTRLMIFQLKQHDLQLAAGVIPLLPLDVWEHAYYLKYHNVRAEYVKAWWNTVNWPAISAAYTAAQA
ncbi:MAG TPA: superoxide dismutase [Tepidisphaeraceae bacterium]|nr:superoxide dismutase [Tepidisphaeraceae bacterium]